MAIWTLKTDEKRIIRYLTVEDVLSTRAKTTDTLSWLTSDICKDNSRIIIIFLLKLIPRCYEFLFSFFFFPVFLCFALRSEARLTYCHKYVLRSNRYFKIQWRGRQRERKKTIGFISKTITLHVHHTYWYISLPFLPDYDVKLPNLAFYGLYKQATTKFYFSFLTWKWSIGIQLQEGSPTFDKVIG